MPLMTKLIDKSIFEKRIQRFVICNAKMREATLKSEQAFLELAGDISPAQLQILLAIGEHSPCTMNQLAKILHFTQANMTQMATRLIHKKFIKRTRSKEDQRVVYVQLLTKGEAICKLHRQHVERTAREWFNKMTDEEQELMLTMWEKYLP